MLLRLVFILSASLFGALNASEIATDRDSHWAKILAQVPVAYRAGAEFLHAHMPEVDRHQLTAAIFLDNLHYAYLARADFIWARELADELFFNDVLPYAVVDETRENWRPEFYEIFSRLLKEKNCQTAREAAHTLNHHLREILQVEYSPQRSHPNQSPNESRHQKIASCTGLSILLITALRAVGIPARLAGVQAWANKSGNHNWVEVYFDNAWHFTEYYPDPQGFNCSWFVNDCAALKPPTHNVWASSFKATPHRFPLVWTSPPHWQTFAEKRTAFYVGLSKPIASATDVAPNTHAIGIIGLDADGQRVAVDFSITDADAREVYRGCTADRFADLNNFTRVNLPSGEYTLTYQNAADKIQRLPFNPATTKKIKLVY